MEAHKLAAPGDAAAGNIYFKELVLCKLTTGKRRGCHSTVCFATLLDPTSLMALCTQISFVLKELALCAGQLQLHDSPLHHIEVRP